MTDLFQAAAGVICVGFDGTTLDDGLVQRLTSLPLAGVILFGRNVQTAEQTRSLTDGIRRLGRNTVIAIDQEGGRVARLRDGVEILPSMMALGAVGDLDLARRAGEQLAFDLRRVGVNVDFAPVADLAIFAMNTVIGARSFGDDPDAVAALAQAFAAGMEAQGMLATFKHFPGHGSTHLDSHSELPEVDEEEAVLQLRDFVPFQRVLSDARAVMTAHIVIKALDPDRPATTSPRILRSLLRDEMGFRGVCFTDCMQMDAIAKGVGSSAGAVEALAAGADCVLISHDFAIAQESVHRIVEAVQQGYLQEARLREAHQRVRALCDSLSGPIPLNAKPPHPGVGREIGRRAVTLLRGEPGAQCDASIVVSFEGQTLEGAQGLHADHASLNGSVPIPCIRLDLQPDSARVRDAIEHVRASAKRPILLMRRAHIYAQQHAAVVRFLQAFPDALVVSTREPFDALSLPQARHVLCTYGDEEPSLVGVSEVIFSGGRAEGRLPVKGTQQIAAR